LSGSTQSCRKENFKKTDRKKKSKTQRENTLRRINLKIRDMKFSEWCCWRQPASGILNLKINTRKGRK
jgi:hypothetical protein